MSKRSRIKKKLIIEGLFALLIAISPILFYSYKYLPINSDNTWSIFGLTFSNNGYDDVTVAFYFYLSKLIPLALLIIWFTTAKNWWYHIILIPISMYAFQLYSVFSEDASKIDENEILYLVAVCMVIIPIVYFIRVKLVDRYVHGIDLEAMEAELKVLKEKQGLTSTLDKEIEIELDENEKNQENQIAAQGISQSLSTDNLKNIFQQFRHALKNWL